MDDYDINDNPAYDSDDGEDGNSDSGSGRYHVLSSHSDASGGSHFYVTGEQLQEAMSSDSQSPSSGDNEPSVEPNPPQQAGRGRGRGPAGQQVQNHARGRAQNARQNTDGRGRGPRARRAVNAPAQPRQVVQATNRVNNKTILRAPHGQFARGTSTAAGKARRPDGTFLPVEKSWNQRLQMRKKLRELGLPTPPFPKPHTGITQDEDYAHLILARMGVILPRYMNPIDELARVDAGGELRQYRDAPERARPRAAPRQAAQPRAPAPRQVGRLIAPPPVRRRRTGNRIPAQAIAPIHPMSEDEATENQRPIRIKQAGPFYREEANPGPIRIKHMGPFVRGRHNSAPITAEQPARIARHGHSFVPIDLQQPGSSFMGAGGGRPLRIKISGVTYVQEVAPPAQIFICESPPPEEIPPEYYVENEDHIDFYPDMDLGEEMREDVYEDHDGVEGDLEGVQGRKEQPAFWSSPASQFPDSELLEIIESMKKISSGEAVRIPGESDPDFEPTRGDIIVRKNENLQRHMVEYYDPDVFTGPIQAGDKSVRLTYDSVNRNGRLLLRILAELHICTGHQSTSTPQWVYLGRALHMLRDMWDDSL